MDILGNYEKEFLKILGIEAVRLENGDYELRNSSNELFRYLGNDQLGKDTFYDFKLGKKTASFSISEEESGVISRTVKFFDNSSNCEFNETTNGDAEFLNASLYTRDLEIFSIQVEPYLNSKELIVWIRTDRKVNDYPYFIRVSMFGIFGIEVEMFDRKETFGPLELNGENFEYVLKEMINKMFDSYDKPKEFFKKLIPVFRLAYDKYEKLIIEHVEEYLRKTEKEREAINQGADTKIALINKERDEELQQSYQKVLKVTSMTNYKKNN